MSKKVPFSVRMEAVKRVQLGESLREVSRVMQLDATEISVWQYLLEHEGPNIVRLHPRVHANYSLRCQGNRIKIYQLRTFADGRPTVEMGLAVTHLPSYSSAAVYSFYNFSLPPLGRRGLFRPPRL